jgi:RNA polymerase sigma factor (sigma-70 family)
MKLSGNISAADLEAALRHRRANEAKLVNLLHERKTSALSLLYDNYSTSLYGTILRIVRAEPEAEDILQETFIRIWNNIGQYHADKGSLFTWMLNIARNLAIDYLRTARHQHELRCSAVEESNPETTADSQVTIREEHIGLRELTRLLSPEQKLVIDLLFFEGYTHPEAAEKLGMPLGSVKTCSRSAIRHLGKLFREKEHERGNQTDDKAY